MGTQITDFDMGDITLKLKVGDDAFLPNLTTRLIASCAEIKAGDRVLDMGCGVGPLAIYAALKGASEVVAVDIMESACQYTLENAELNGVADKVRVVQSDVFDAVPKEEFDVILDDVSGMAEECSRISPWFAGGVPTGGYDGTEITVAMLDSAHDYMTENSSLYFPVLSLSDAPKILKHAQSRFGKNVTMITEKWIPFCKEFKDAMGFLEQLKSRGIIDFITRRSRHLWRLQIYRAQSGKAQQG